MSTPSLGRASSSFVVGEALSLRYTYRRERPRNDATFARQLVDLAEDQPPPYDRVAHCLFFGLADEGDLDAAEAERRHERGPDHDEAGGSSSKDRLS